LTIQRESAQCLHVHRADRNKKRQRIMKTIEGKAPETEAEGPRRVQVAEFIREGILAGKFLAGSRITERQVCEETGASRSSVREAIRQLETEGYLKSVPNRGSVVATLTAQEAADIYQVRAVLEGLAVRNFINMSSEEERRQLREALDALSSAIDRKEVPAQLKAIERFYDTLLGGCYNSTLVDMLRLLHARIARLRATSIISPGRIKESMRELDDIASAIEANDADRAWEATVRHMEITSSVALRVIGRKHAEH
jgi:DNA-binding GntR family transcriptional regulator